jgi:hypothetical protein
LVALKALDNKEATQDQVDALVEANLASSQETQIPIIMLPE